MSNGWTADDFGTSQVGPQFQWLHERLIVHGFPLNKYTSTLKERVRAFQLSKGFQGSGADGYIGPVTLRHLKAIPVVQNAISTKNWKQTMPTGEPGHPDEIFPIGSFSQDPWFVQKNGHLIFRANAGGVTTPTSVMPRSEFREMTADGKAKWDSFNGLDHSLTGRLAINALPPLRPIVVFGQCHDAIDDVFMLAAVGEPEDRERFDVQVWRSLGKGKGNEKKTLLRDIRLGAFFDYQMKFTEGGFSLKLNDLWLYDYPGSWEDCYWKAGCYLQTNVSKGEKPSAYGEVEYSGLLALHR